MKVASGEEAVRLVNDSTYGLQATIISSNMKHARHLAERFEAGCVTINDAQTNYMALGLPMGGWKESGPRRPARRRRNPQIHPASKRSA